MKATAAVAKRGARTAPENVLGAAFRCFARYGYRRVALEQIAQEAGISRAALYLHYKDKEDLFRAVSREVHEKSQAAAEEAARAEGDVVSRIEAALLAKHGKFFAIVSGSPHVAELLEERNRLCGDVSEAFRKRFQKLMRSVLEEADARGELDLAGAGVDAGEAAELFVAGAKGVEMSGAEPLSPSLYRRRVARLVRVLAAGLRARAPRARRRMSN
ncbi:MAG TPA: helix-turn-helix domain-containing protein [Myxococcota bacterium]|nr:helix-turn-helix domain-containing protein [Myxococcota bacterium]